MKKEDMLSRITLDRKILMGKPTIRGLRISVEQILKALANGVAVEDLLTDYPELETQDIQQIMADYAEELMGHFCVYQNGRLRIR